MSFLWPDEPRARVERLLLALAGLFFVVAMYQVVCRMLFPWDLYVWSESPFMTNMLKLSRGASVFDAPRDANSWVYAPGLEYLCFALLRPLGLALDVRACRFVIVGLGLTASWCAMRSSTRVFRVLEGRDAPVTYRVFAFFALSLLLFRSFTSDVCHPDNAYIAHAMITLLLCLRAFERPTVVRAVTAVVVSAIGVLFKQTAGAGFVGVALLFLVFGRGRWPLRVRALLLVLGIAIDLGALLLLRSHPNSKFFLFDVLSLHEVHVHRAADILRVGAYSPYVALTMLLGIYGAFRLLVGVEDRPQSSMTGNVVLVTWLALGSEVLLSLASYVKAMGAWNNFGIVCSWCTVLALPSLWHAFGELSARRASGGAALIAALMAVLVVSLMPLKMPPTEKQYAFGQALENRIRRDLSEGRRVLLPHGTMPLVRAGMTDVPLDRSNTVLEMNMAGLASFAGTKDRIEGHAYDIVYLLGADFYGPVIDEAIAAHYREIGFVPGDGTPIYNDDYTAGYQNFMRPPVRIMEWASP